MDRWIVLPFLRDLLTGCSGVRVLGFLGIQNYFRTLTMSYTTTFQKRETDFAISAGFVFFLCSESSRELKRSRLLDGC